MPGSCKHKAKRVKKSHLPQSCGARINCSLCEAFLHPQEVLKLFWTVFFSLVKPLTETWAAEGRRDEFVAVRWKESSSLLRVLPVTDSHIFEEQSLCSH